jgi:hypothetical protein
MDEDLVWKCSPFALLFHPLQECNDDDLDHVSKYEMESKGYALSGHEVDSSLHPRLRMGSTGMYSVLIRIIHRRVLVARLYMACSRDDRFAGRK